MISKTHQRSKTYNKILAIEDLFYTCAIGTGIVEIMLILNVLMSKVPNVTELKVAMYLMIATVITYIIKSALIKNLSR